MLMSTWVVGGVWITSLLGIGIVIAVLLLGLLVRKPQLLAIVIAMVLLGLLVRKPQSLAGMAVVLLGLLVWKPQC